MKQSQTTFTVGCNWWTGQKILRLVKKYNPVTASRTEFNEIVFSIIGLNDEKKQEIYELLLQNGAKKIRVGLKIVF
jgi:hypothetical protein